MPVLWPRVLDELIPSAQTDRTAPHRTMIIAELAFIRSRRRGHYELAMDLPQRLRMNAAFDLLARAT